VAEALFPNPLMVAVLTIMPFSAMLLRG